MPLTELLLVRHGESEANVAAAEAYASGALRIAVPARDADVELSSTGVAQATALGRRLGELPSDSISERSPLHSVWNVPSLSTRL